MIDKPDIRTVNGKSVHGHVFEALVIKQRIGKAEEAVLGDKAWVKRGVTVGMGDLSTFVVVSGVHMLDALFDNANVEPGADRSHTKTRTIRALGEVLAMYLPPELAHVADELKSYEPASEL